MIKIVFFKMHNSPLSRLKCTFNYKLKSNVSFPLQFLEKKLTFFKMAVMRQFRLLLWKNYLQQVSKEHVLSVYVS